MIEPKNKKTILYEGLNLTLPNGTGIATYARNLGRIARSMGYTTSLLIPARRGIDTKSRALAEVAVFDAHRPGRWEAEQLKFVLSLLVGAPFGIAAAEFPDFGATLKHVPHGLNEFSPILAATRLFDRARAHFHRWGSLATVQVPHTPMLFHATHQVPFAIPGCPNIVTIHDLIPLRLPHATLDNKKYFYDLICEVCRKADHVITVSEFSRQEIIELTKISEDRITSTGQTADIPEELLARSVDQVANKLDTYYGLSFKEYFLFIGALEPKKNIDRLIDAYAMSGSKFPLVIAGGLGWQYEPLLARIDDERFEQYLIKGNTIYPSRRVRNLAYVSFPQLISLIRGARALLFPSLYEGFGLPVLEAMTLGIPVMTSNRTSLPEVAGDAALLVDPYDVDAMVAALRRLDTDEELLADLSQRGLVQSQRFSQERYRERLGAVYSKFFN